MKILLIGNLGYIGPVLVNKLLEKKFIESVDGYDNGLFIGCLAHPLKSNDNKISNQYYGDVRNPKHLNLSVYDAVIYLAAISNDPMGNLYEEATLQINRDAAVNMARMAADAGVKRFLFASSCSVYGAGGVDAKTEDSSINPLTAYARSKVDAEELLSKLANENFNVICFRFATACGASPRLRLDLVLNDFVASAILTKTIKILSNGEPLRPLISVEEMSEAFSWGVLVPKNSIPNYLTLNTGFNSWNFSVKEIAEQVNFKFPKTKVEINLDAPEDKRSYKVNFDKYAKLTGREVPLKNIGTVITELADNINDIHFNSSDLRASHYIRLNVLKSLREDGRINELLYFK